MPCVTNALKNRHELEFRTNSLKAINNVDKSSPSEAMDDITRENIHLYALIGHHFNRSLMKEIKNFDPHLVSDYQRIKVHFPSRQLPGSEWMIYSKDGTLQGVPLSRHKGLHNFYITIFGADEQEGSRNTLPCTVEVLTEDSPLETQHTHRHNNVHDKIHTLRRCPRNEPITIAGVQLEVPVEGMNHIERVECVRTIEERFGVQSKDVVFTSSPETKGGKLPILSGPGNAAKVRTHRGDRAVPSMISISWPLGCSSDMIGDIPMLENLETSSFDGSLARALGYDVIEWFVTNSIPKASRRRRYRRRASKDSTSGKYDDEVDGATTLDENDRDGPGKRNRVPANSIKATPYPQIPIRAVPLDNQPMARTYAGRLSTPDVRPPKTEDMPADYLGNSAPMVLFGMTDVNASMDTYMEYQIPNSVFFDAEDNMSYDMDMELHDEDSLQAVQEDSTWLKYDAKAHIMYGVPDHTAVAKRALILIVRDSGGKSASCSFFLYVDLTARDKDATSHKFTFVLSESPEFSSDNALYASFGRKLADAMAKTEKIPGDLVMSQTGTNKGGLRFVKWFDSSLTGSAWCKADEIRDTAMLMVGDEAMEGRNKPKQEFANKFRPEFKLKTIVIQFYGPCKNFITTTTTTTSTTTTTTTTSTAIMTDEISTLPPSTVPSFNTTKSLDSVKSVTEKNASKDNSTIFEVSSERLTTPYSPVLILEKQLPEIVAKTGIPSRFVIPSETFSDVSGLGTKPQFVLMGSETWIGLDSDSLTLYLMATGDEVLELTEYNSSYKRWDGSLSVTNTDGEKVATLKLRVLIERETGHVKKPNHKFVVTLKEYNLKTFRASDRMRLVRLIGDIFNDPVEEHIYLQPLEEGSVIVTWYNTTLGFAQPCPDHEIAKLGRSIFIEKEHIQPSVIRRFRDSNFTFTDFKLKRTDLCPKVVPAVTEKGPDLNAAGPGGNTTTIVIIIVIIICLVVIIAILVIKCRKAAVARKNKKTSRSNGTHNETALGSTNPDLQDTPRIKKGVPIIFQDEIGMETSGNTSASATTPLMPKRSNGGSPKPDIQEGNLYVAEDIPFTTPSSNQPVSPPTPMMSNRPPPPYTKLR